MKKIALSVLYILCTSIAAFAVTLKWDIPKDDRLEMTRTAQVKYLINDKMERLFQERNIIDLTCYAKNDETSSVKGVFSVYERDTATDVFHLREQYPSDFTIDKLGRFTVAKKYYMPNLRHVPTFPGKDIAKGEKWSANADMVLNSFSVPFKLSFPTEYVLADIQKKDDIEIAVIRYTFLVDMNLSGGSYPADFPLKILGKDEGVINWDLTNNRPVSMTEKYRIIFFFPTKTKAIGANEFQMFIDSQMKMYKPVTKDEKEQAKKDLKKEMPDGVDVDTDKRGLVLRLGDVLFDFDSAALRSDSRTALEKIADILKKKYPDREIIVEGHTDSMGEDQYNQRLSKDRARSVAEYLKPRAGTEKLSYRGFGKDKPIADNASKEGRQKNRRVEIIIKLQ